MPRANPVQHEIAWAKIFLGFLKEAESESDQIRLRGMGIEWTSDAADHHGTDLMQYFQTLDSHRGQSLARNQFAKAVGSRIVRGA